MKDRLLHKNEHLEVGDFDSESDTWPVFHYTGNECSGCLAEFLTKGLAEDYVEWQHELRAKFEEPEDE